MRSQYNLGRNVANCGTALYLLVRTRTRINTLLLALCVGGCQQQAVKLDYPVSWSKPLALLPELPAEGCVLPIGHFSNHGESSNPAFDPPTLSKIMFDKRLAGFPIESVIVGSEPEASLFFQGVVGGVPLRYKKYVDIETACKRTWQGESTTDAVDATLVTEAVLWTGGLLLPLNQKYHYTLNLLEDGALLVHLQVKDTMLGFYLVPFSMKDEYWIRYPQLQPQPDLPQQLPQQLPGQSEPQSPDQERNT